MNRPSEDLPAPPTIDAVAAERWRLHAPALSPWLHEEVGRRMQERLQWIRREPTVWANWSPLRGGLESHALVARRYPQAQVYLVEPSPSHAAAARVALQPRLPWWQRLGRAPAGNPKWSADGQGLQVDMVWSNMQLHTAAQPQQMMRRWCDSLAADGFLMFSCLGPDTARELRAVYRRLGWPVAGHEFTDMHDWGDMLVQSGFAEPVMDMERIVLTYDGPQRLLRELREIGRNLHPARFAALRGRGWRRGLEAELARAPELAAQGGDGGPDDGLDDALQEAQGPASARLALTIEVIYGHAFKAPPRMPVASSSSIALDDMRSLLRSGRKPARP